MIRLFIYSILFFTISYNTSLANTKNDYSIALVVGNEVISLKDVKERLQIALVTSGVKSSPSVESALLPQIIQVLIDEQLYIQEAKKLDINISEREIQHAISNIEKQNSSKFDEFLEKNKLPKKPFVSQIRSQIAWSKVLASKIRPKIVITDIEVKEEQENIVLNSEREEILLSEITLPIASPNKMKQARISADKLVNMVKDGSSFAEVARQFSKSFSAESGGNIGWVETRMLSSALQNIIRNMNVGGISEPILADNSYKILRVNDKRLSSLIKNSDLDESIVHIKQLFVPISEVDAELRSKYMATMEGLRSEINHCPEMEIVAGELEFQHELYSMTSKIKDFNVSFQDILRNLQVNYPAPVIITDKGLHLFLICKRELPASIVKRLPNQKKVKGKLFQRKLMIHANKYLRDLRRNTFIEIRV
jgi:peptidyl-prolyl cis-trans isomerase SurA